MWKLIGACRALIYKAFFRHYGYGGYIAKPILVHGPAFVDVGYKVRIFPGLRLEAHGSDVKIGDLCSVGHNVTLVAGGGESLVIGRGCTISANVFISSVDHNFADPTQHYMEQGLIGRRTQIGDGCFIGFGAVVLPGSVLGKGCIVGANSVVRAVVPAHSMVAGSPARVIKKYSEVTGQWEVVKE